MIALKQEFLSTALLALVLISHSLFGQTSQPQKGPPSFTAEIPRHTLLLADEKGREIRTASAWEKQRKLIREQWRGVLGPFPDRKPPLKTQILATEDLPRFTRQHIQYQVEDGLFTDGYLLTPKNGGRKLPGIVVFHPTTPVHAKGVAGLDPEYAEEKRQAVQLVERGYVVWCPRNYIFTEGADWAGNARRVLAAHPNWTGMTRMVWDGIRAVDFLESLPTVDRRRMGCIGHSLGGKEALYAPAFDERIKAAVSSEGGIGLKFSNWDAVWYLGPKIQQPGFTMENDQVLALVAPRAFLLLAGDSADSDKSLAFIGAAKAVYKLLGAPDNLSMFNHRLGHRYPPEARQAAEAFLDKHLKR